MAKNVLVDLNLNKNQILNALMHPTTTAPSSPSAGQVYFNSTNGTLSFYDGTAWVNIKVGEIADNNLGFVTGDAAYDALALKLNLAGGTMSGALAMGDGTTNNKITNLADGENAKDAVNKSQLDAVASAGLSIVATVETDATKASKAYSVGDYLILNNTLYKVTADIAQNGAITSGTNVTAATVGAELKRIDGAKLNLTGGTMSGAIAMGNNKITGLADGTADTDAAAFGQVNVKANQIVIAGVESTTSASKAYSAGEYFIYNGTLYKAAAAITAGDEIPGSNTAVTVAGELTGIKNAIPLAEDTTTPVMDGTASCGSATTWSRSDHVHPHDTSKLDLAGGTMTGAIAMGSNKITGLGTPTADADAATKKYVDDGIAGLGSYLTFKGTKTSLSAIESIDDPKIGDVWIISGSSTASQNGLEYVCTAVNSETHKGTWELIGANVDMTAYALLDSPAFINTPTAPTAATGTDTTQIATTAFVQQELAAMSGKTFVNSGSIASGSTTVTVNYTGTLVNAYATMGGEEVVLDKAVDATNHTVTFTVAATSATITCNVVYSAAAAYQAPHAPSSGD